MVIDFLLIFNGLPDLFWIKRILRGLQLADSISRQSCFDCKILPEEVLYVIRPKETIFVSKVAKSLISFYSVPDQVTEYIKKFDKI